MCSKDTVARGHGFYCCLHERMIPGQHGPAVMEEDCVLKSDEEQQHKLFTTYLYGSYTVQFSYAGEASVGYVTVYNLTILYT